MKQLFVISVVLLLSLEPTIGKTFTSNCELAHALKDNGFPKNQLPDWVCLVWSESSGRTNVIGPANSDGSHDYGLFQLNDRYWCKVGSRGGGCDADCNSFLSDNISGASKCAQKVYRESGGFSAWYGWQNKCKGKPLPNLNNCGL